MAEPTPPGPLQPPVPGASGRLSTLALWLSAGLNTLGRLAPRTPFQPFLTQHLPLSSAVASRPPSAASSLPLPPAPLLLSFYVTG